MQPDPLARARAAAAALKPNTAKASTSAPDPGEVLAEISRSDGTLLRVALRDFEGKRFVTIAIWEKGTGGAWYPVRGKATTIRLRELGEVLEGLAIAAERVAAGGGTNGTPP